MSPYQNDENPGLTFEFRHLITEAVSTGKINLISYLEINIPHLCNIHQKPVKQKLTGNFIQHYNFIGSLDTSYKNLLIISRSTPETILYTILKTQKALLELLIDRNFLNETQEAELSIAKKLKKTLFLMNNKSLVSRMRLKYPTPSFFSNQLTLLEKSKYPLNYLSIFCSHRKNMTSKEIKHDISFKFSRRLYVVRMLPVKPLGRVFVINGVSSSGKTTFSNHLRKHGFLIISFDDTCEEILLNHIKQTLPERLLKAATKFLAIDDFRKIWSKYWINLQKYKPDQLIIIDALKSKINISREFPSYSLICEKLYGKALKYTLSGQHVVIDTVLLSEQQLSQLAYYFKFHSFKLGLLYLPIVKNLKNSFFRNMKSYYFDLCDYRAPEKVIRQFLKIYSLKSKLTTFSKKMVLGKIQKSEIRNITKSVLLNTNYLSYMLYKETNSTRSKNIEKSASSAINQIYTQFKLHKSNSLFVTPILKYNFFIYPSNMPPYQAKGNSDIKHKSIGNYL